MTEAATGQLMQYSYPGNVRELRNLLERAILLADGDTIDGRHLPTGPVLGRNAPSQQPAAEEEILPLEEVERRYVRQALQRLGGDKRELARRLGLSERTLYRKLG